MARRPTLPIAARPPPGTSGWPSSDRGPTGRRSPAAYLADDRIGVLEAGDLLPDYALAVVAERLAGSPGLAVVYSDEDTVDADGAHRDPIFKPDWSPCLQAGAPYVGRLALVRASALEPGAEALAALFRDDRTAVDRVLAGVAPADGRAPAPGLVPPSRRWVRIAAAIDPTEACRGEQFAWPPVGIVIPTRDRADLLAECVRGLRDRTDYPAYEIVVVDNGSTTPDALALLRDLKSDPRVKVVERPGPFNFSALSNDGAKATTAPVLAFVNNDIVVVDDGWLKPMVRFAVMPQIGVVGAKLLFPDGLSPACRRRARLRRDRRTSLPPDACGPSRLLQPLDRGP